MTIAGNLQIAGIDDRERGDFQGTVIVSLDTFLTTIERHSTALAMVGSCLVTIIAGLWAFYRYIDDRKHRNIAPSPAASEIPVQSVGQQDGSTADRLSLRKALLIALRTIPGAALGFVFSPIAVWAFFYQTFSIVMVALGIMYLLNYEAIVYQIALFAWWLGTPIATSLMAIGAGVDDAKVHPLTVNTIGLGYGVAAGMIGEIGIALLFPASVIAHLPMPGGLPLIGAAAGAVGGLLAAMK